MCLINTFEKPDFQIGKFWKILYKTSTGRLLSPFYNYIWKPLVNQCEHFYLVKTNNKDWWINDGIHVFATKEGAEYYKNTHLATIFDTNGLVIIQVGAEVQDLIAIGCQEGFKNLKTLCFKQVYLDPEDYKEALTLGEAKV